MKTSQYLPRNMYTDCLFCGVCCVWHPNIYPYHSELPHWNRGNHAICPMPLKQLWNAVRYRNPNLVKSRLPKAFFVSYAIVLIFCTELGSDTAVLCAKFQTNWTIGTEVVDERDFARFQFKICFGRISYIAQHPRLECIGARPLTTKTAITTKTHPNHNNSVCICYRLNIRKFNLYRFLDVAFQWTVASIIQCGKIK